MKVLIEEDSHGRRVYVCPYCWIAYTRLNRCHQHMGEEHIIPLTEFLEEIADVEEADPFA